MNTKHLYFLILLFNLILNPFVEFKTVAQTQTLSWAREGFGTGIDAGNAVTVDAAGSIKGASCFAFQYHYKNNQLT